MHIVEAVTNRPEITLSSRPRKGRDKQHYRRLTNVLNFRTTTFRPVVSDLVFRGVRARTV
jgi:hypothetical protein